MKKPDYIPADYKRIKVVGSLMELFNEQFGGPDGVNAVLFPRTLSHDFNALAGWLEEGTEYIRKFTPSTENRYPYFDVPRLFASKKYMKPVMAVVVDAIVQDMDAASDKMMRAELRLVRPGRGPDMLHHDNVASFNSMMGRHYSLREGAEVFSFRPGDLWRQLSTPYLKNVAPPYIHRAPALKAGDTPRLLLVASC